MARPATKKSTLTSPPPALQRQAKRLARQQKRLDQELMATAPLSNTSATTRSRGITLKDLKIIEPMTDTQEDFFDSYVDSDAIVLAGSAGTGKSYIAMYQALLDILEPESQYHKIAIIRSTAQVRDQGFLPGDLHEKAAPFEEPYVEICANLLKRKDAYEKLKDMGKIEFASTSFLRGMTFDNTIVIFDECQNETFAAINTVATRLGKNSKLIMIGDGAQTDISKNKNDMSGFVDFMRVARILPDFKIHMFTSDDIVRSNFVKSWIMACEKLGVI